MTQNIQNELKSKVVHTKGTWYADPRLGQIYFDHLWNPELNRDFKFWDPEMGISIDI